MKHLHTTFCGRRVLSLLLATLLLFAAVSVLILPAGAAPYTYTSYTMANNDKAPKEVAAGSVMGLRLGMNESFDSIALSLCTWSTTDSAARLSIYKWDRNCKATEAGTPIATEFLDPLADNGMATLTFDAQPAGEYYITISETRGKVGVWAVNGNSMTKGLVYFGGTGEKLDLCLSVHFLDKPDECFTTLSPEEEDAPAKSDVTVPTDSLFYQNAAMPDTWVFTDGLGRVSLTYADVGGVREDKTVAMFYWTWHEELGRQGATNTTELLKEYPDAKNNYNHKAWIGTGHYCFWNEPIYGFYRTTDEWVLRKQAELLANAGVDVVFNDNTNGSMTWKSGYTAQFEEWIKASEDGVASPKISFLLPFADTTDGSRKQLKELYADIYAEGKYQELWYYLGESDKPMIIAHRPSDSSMRDITKFFNFRGGQPAYLLGGDPPVGQWGWLHTYPQPVYYGSNAQKKKGTPEMITVGVAMNHNYKTHEITAMNGEYVMGRSYTSTYENRYEVEGNAASLWGYNFSEQFDRALEVDPSVVFVTGWNEWHAWRQPNPWGGTNSLVSNALVDQFDNEFSRDLEPTKGELKDHYYYLLVNYVRKYKGVNPIPTPSVNKTIDLAGSEAQWKDVAPYYASYVNNISDRDHAGYAGYSYTETSGRNDIIGAQVARDDDYLYFHVECASDITACKDSRWMNLYLDTDQTNQGWETFDYAVRGNENGKLILERFALEGDYMATEVIGNVEYALDGRYLTVKIAKSDLRLSGDDYTVNFTWTDNVHDENDYDNFSGDILDFYISGDVAPGGRFKYSFVSTADNAAPETETETDAATEPATETDAPDAETDTVPDATTADTEASSDTAADASATEAPATEESGCASGLQGCAVLLLLGAAGLCLVTTRKRRAD